MKLKPNRDNIDLLINWLKSIKYDCRNRSLSLMSITKQKIGPGGCQTVGCLLGEWENLMGAEKQPSDFAEWLGIPRDCIEWITYRTCWPKKYLLAYNKLDLLDFESQRDVMIKRLKYFARYGK